MDLVATIRASNIGRDADILQVYKHAGSSRILMGIETTNAETLRQIRKGTTTSIDREAISLLRDNNILSQAAYVVGFHEETDREEWQCECDQRSVPDSQKLLSDTKQLWSLALAVHPVLWAYTGMYDATGE